MIIVPPQDAKLPEHLYSYSSLPTTTSRNPFSSPEDPLERPSEITYPPTRSSIAPSELPPAYVEPPEPQPQEIRQLSRPTDKRLVRRRKRLRLLAGCILFLYVATTSILLVLFWTGHLKRSHPFVHPWPNMNGAFSSVLPDGFRPSGAPYSDGTASKCNAWSSQKTTTSPTGTAPLYTDYLQYVLQPNINTTSLLKVFIHTGSNAADSGSLLVTSDDSISAPFVDVTMSYRDKTIRNTTSVCIMNTIDSVGLGIYTSNASAPEAPSFDLVLHLPSSVFVDSLSTVLPRFSQNIGKPHTHFKTNLGRLELAGAFSPVIVAGLDVTAQNIVAETSFSTIWGDFTTSQSLTLKTSQAAINVNVSLVRMTDDSKPVSLSLTTENAIVQSAVTLSTSSNTTCSDPSVSDFTISATSANAPVSVIVNTENGSTAAKIDVTAVSSYAPVVVSLDPLFEGVFSLASGVGADLDNDDNISDPKGLGRERQYIITDQSTYNVDGSVYWAYPPNPGFIANNRLGTANLTTQHAKAVLYLKKSCSGKSCPSLSFPVSSP